MTACRVLVWSEMSCEWLIQHAVPSASLKAVPRARGKAEGEEPKLTLRRIEEKVLLCLMCEWFRRARGPDSKQRGTCVVEEERLERFC